MDLIDLTLAPLEIPLRASFKHHSAERKMTQAVLVTARSADGETGKGEGCPREYVTGESLASCRAFFEAHRGTWAAFPDPEAMDRWAERNEAPIDANPAAWCAVESALLDMFARRRGLSLEAMLGLPASRGPFRYTAVLGDSAPEIFRAQAARYLAMGFSDFKIKATGNKAADAARMEFLRAGSAAPPRIRIDANNLFHGAEDALAYLEGLSPAPFAIEEPLAAFDYLGLETMAREGAPKIILDESFLGVKDFESIAGLAGKAIINIRVSKLGGVKRSLRVAREAGERGIPVIVGAQVGETSLLTRCAWPIATACGGNLLAQEGGFGTLLLESDITSKPLMFGKGGLLDPADFLEPGGAGTQIRYA